MTVSVSLSFFAEKSRLTVDKLNKEFEKNEGIGENFGSFLMELDDLANDILGSKLKKKSLRQPVKQAAPSSSRRTHEDAEEEEEEGEVEGESMEDQGSEADDQDEEDEEEEEEGDDSPADHSDEAEEEKAKFTYRPAPGEDIYGRVVEPEKAAAAGKYVPPARRQLALSEKDQLLKRKVRGLVNKLSEQTRDSILRELKATYETSSHNLTSEAVLDYLLDLATSASARLTGLVPLYASLLAALYFAVSADVVYYAIERIFGRLAATCRGLVEQLAASPAATATAEDFTLSHHRPAYNLLLFLLYLYNFRVLHHSFLLELLQALVDGPASASLFPGADQLAEAQRVHVEEMKMELLEAAVHHCVDSLRHDDPAALKLFGLELSRKMKLSAQLLREKAAAAQTQAQAQGTGEEGEGDQYSRLQFLYECVAEQIGRGGQKMRKLKEPVLSLVADTRKWLGSNKRLLGNKMGDIVVRLTLADLLNVDKQGRWWRTGASWVGRQQQQQQAEAAAKTAASSSALATASSSSSSGAQGGDSQLSASLQQAARRCHMNTPTRQAVFEQLMLSRDVLDAYERVLKLGLAGKHDREVVRVVVECCLRERQYNSFYKELLKLLADFNRQTKLTAQFQLWDLLKLLDGDSDGHGHSQAEDDGDQDEDGADQRRHLSNRQVLNLGRLAADLVELFVVPLSALFKVLDIAAINESAAVQLFLLTFFVQLLSSASLADDTLQTICDRIGTTADYRLVCDNLLCFLEVTSPTYSTLLALLTLTLTLPDALGHEGAQGQVLRGDLRADEAAAEAGAGRGARDLAAGPPLPPPRGRRRRRRLQRRPPRPEEQEARRQLPEGPAGLTRGSLPSLPRDCSCN